jgi:hypothetical protein
MYGPSAAGSTTTTPKTFNNVVMGAGDYVFVAGITADQTTNITAPTGGTGLSWTAMTPVNIGQNCWINGWYTTGGVGSGQTSTLTIARSATSNQWHANCFVITGTSGVGATVSTNGTGTGSSYNITETAANSCVIGAIGDWNAVSNSSRTARTNAGAITEDDVSMSSGQYSWYFFHHLDAGTATTDALGYSAPTGQKWVAVGIEFKLAAGGSTVTATVSFAADSTLTVGGTIVKVGALSLAASSTLTVGALLLALGAVSFAATSTATFGGLLQAKAALSLVADSTFGVSAGATVPAAVTFGADSTATFGATPVRVAQATFTADSTATFGSIVQRPAQITFAADSTLTLTATTVRVGALSLTADSTLSLTARQIFMLALSLAATSFFNVSAGGQVSAALSLQADSSLSLTGLLVKPAQVTFSASSTLSLTGTLQKQGALVLVAGSTLTVGAIVLKLGVFVLQGNSTFTLSAVQLQLGALTFSATSFATFIVGTQVTVVAVSVGKNVYSAVVGEGSQYPIAVGRGDSSTINVTV